MIKHIIETDIASSEKLGLVKTNDESINILEDGTIFVNPKILEDINTAKEDILGLDKKIDTNVEELNLLIEKTKEEMNSSVEELNSLIDKTHEKIDANVEDLGLVIQETQEVITVILKNAEALEKDMDFLDGEMLATKEEIKETIKELSDRLDNIDSVTNIEEFVEELNQIKRFIDDLQLCYDELRRRIGVIEHEYANAHIGIVNVRTLGITGDENIDNTAQIQQAFESRGKLYFPKGTYILSERIDVYSDTYIEAHPQAIFLRKHSGSMFTTFATEDTTRYNGEKRITFKGGVYRADGNNGGSNIFSVFHAEDVTFENVTCLNVVGAHAMDLVGSRNIKVLYCKFKGYNTITVENSNKESIQIDAAGCYSYPIFSNKDAATYDGTPTCDVIIHGCEFGASDEFPAQPVAIGQHGQHALNGSRYKNIRVTNNKFFGCDDWTYSYAIRPFSWENAVIANNTIENYKTSIFLDLFAIVVEPHGTTVRDDNSQFLQKGDEETFFLASRNVSIANNIIIPSKKATAKCGIWINASNTTITNSGEDIPKHRAISITGNVITLPVPNLKSYAIDVDILEDAVISGNTIINNAKSDSIAVNVLDLCKNVKIGTNTYKNIKEANECSIESTSSNIRKIGRTLLWSGKAFEANTVIDLKDSMDNYDILMFDVYLYGQQNRFIKMEDSVLKSFREVNLGDSETSTFFGVAEINVKRVTDRQITLTHNKKQEMANGENIWGNMAVSYEQHYIKAIYGVNY